MNILAVETTTPILSVALCRDAAILGETTVACGRAHSERLLETIHWVLDQSGTSKDDLNILAVSVGPGSFTGARVGIAAMKGLALGLKLPLVGVPSLDAMTRLSHFQDGAVCPILDAKMAEVFGAHYHFENGVRTKLTPDRVCSVEDLLADLSGPVTVLGDGVDLYIDRIHSALPEAQFVAHAHHAPRASAVAAEALQLLSEGDTGDPAAVKPVYLRKSQAEEAHAAKLQEVSS